MRAHIAADDAVAEAAARDQRQRGAAKGALGGGAADHPVRLSAAGAVIRFVLTIGDTIPGMRLADAEIEHSLSPSNQSINDAESHCVPAATMNGHDEAFISIDELQKSHICGIAPGKDGAKMNGI